MVLNEKEETRNKFIVEYFEMKMNNYKKLGAECDMYYNPANKLYDEGKITLQELDSLNDATNGMYNFVLELLACSPEIYDILQTYKG